MPTINYLLNSKELLPHEKDYFQRIIDLKGTLGDYEDSLEYLLIFLSRLLWTEDRHIDR
jgi:hypothetical protein